MIPFHRVSTSANEKKYLEEVYTNGKFCGDGPFGKKCEAKLKKYTGAPHALVTSSCTHALDMSMKLIASMRTDKKEVLVPSFTFSSTANCIILAGLTPVFCEIDEATLNISVKDVEAKINKNTLAILPVHYAGVPCDMDEINAIAKKWDCFVVEDAAHAIGSKYKGRDVGNLSDVSLFSFHETKNISCGEGGAFLTRNSEINERAHVFREKGTNRSQFIRGLVDKYTWVAEGSSPLIAEPLSAILLGQLEFLHEYNQTRKQIHENYIKALKPLHDKELIRLPSIPSHVDSNYHLFFIRLKNQELRNSLLDYTRANGVQTTFHYIPLHNSPFGKSIAKTQETLPVTDKGSQTLLRLPLYPNLTEAEQNKVISVVTSWSNTL